MTGLDLIQHQLLTGTGEPVSLPTSLSSFHGIECRVNPNSFSSDNLVQGLRWPSGCNARADSHLYAGYQLTDAPSHGDAMLAKIICYDHNREAAIRRMNIARSEDIILGIDHNHP